MKVLNNLTDLGISLDELYDEPKKQINIHLSDKFYVFHVVLDNRGVDCKISSMGANLWFRTRNGQNYKKYSSLKALQIALVNSVKRYVETEGNLSFKLSDEVYSI